MQKNNYYCYFSFTLIQIQIRFYKICQTELLIHYDGKCQKRGTKR